MAEIVGVLGEMLLRMGLGFGVKDGGFGSEHSKGHVVDGDGEGEDQGYKDLEVDVSLWIERGWGNVGRSKRTMAL